MTPGAISSRASWRAGESAASSALATLPVLETYAQRAMALFEREQDAEDDARGCSGGEGGGESGGEDGGGGGGGEGGGAGGSETTFRRRAADTD